MPSTAASAQRAGLGCRAPGRRPSKRGQVPMSASTSRATALRQSRWGRGRGGPPGWCLCASSPGELGEGAGGRPIGPPRPAAGRVTTFLVGVVSADGRSGVTRLSQTQGIDATNAPSLSQWSAVLHDHADVDVHQA
jgi:hypothetical protein